MEDQLSTATKQKFLDAIAYLPTLFLSAAGTPAPEALQMIQEILEEFYQDGIDRVESAQLNDKGEIIGVFIDQVGIKSVKRYKYLIQEEEVKYKLINPAEVEQFSVLLFAAKQKQCVKGTLCKGTCISAKKTCQGNAPDPATKQKITKAKQSLGGKAKKGTAPSVASPKTANQPPSTSSNTQEPPSYILERGEDSKKSKSNNKIDKELNQWRTFADRKKAKDSDYLDNAAIVTNVHLDHIYTPEQTRVLRDANGTLQAGASVKIGETYKIEYLATAPWNIKQGDKRHTKGAGTALMAELIAEAVKEGKDITLEALPKANGFYKKIGFKDLGQAEDAADGVNLMRLTQKEAKKFLATRGALKFSFYDDLLKLEEEANGAFCVGESWKTPRTEEERLET
jgi:hypothetical protein